MRKNIISVIGARPNFMKMAPIINELNILKLDNIVVHTGQHYDQKMSEDILKDLGFQDPEYFLGAGGGTQVNQIYKIMKEFEEICLKEKPVLVIVAGDVNSTLACALVAVKMDIKVAHVEAGLRSDDLKMPEEINRILTDRISDILFTTEMNAEKNLTKEGISLDKIHFVGNCMIDSVKKFITKAKTLEYWKKLGLNRKEYLLATIHRPSNVDSKNDLSNVVKTLNTISKQLPIVFPIHPRTRKKIDEFSLSLNKNISLLEPLSYIPFLSLMSESKIIITDSGGIQEEATFLGVPCITMRENTERPITVEIGTNILAGIECNNIISIFNKIIKKDNFDYKIPPLWDGHAGKRIINVIKDSI